MAHQLKAFVPSGLLEPSCIVGGSVCRFHMVDRISLHILARDWSCLFLVVAAFRCFLVLAPDDSPGHLFMVTIGLGSRNGVDYHSFGHLVDQDCCFDIGVLAPLLLLWPAPGVHSTVPTNCTCNLPYYEIWIGTMHTFGCIRHWNVQTASRECTGFPFEIVFPQEFVGTNHLLVLGRMLMWCQCSSGPSSVCGLLLP